MAYQAPGVYFADVASPTAGSAGATGRIGASLGTAPKGSTQPTTPYVSLADFIRDYGDPAAYPQYTLLQAGAAFFQQGAQGSGLTPGFLPARVGATLATGTISGSTGSISVTARPTYAGTEGNALSVAVGTDTWIPSMSAYMLTFSVYNGGSGVGSQENWSVYDTSNGTQADFLVYQKLNASSQIVSASAYVAGTWPTPGTTALAGGTDGLNATIQQTDVDKLQAVPCDFVHACQGDLGTMQMIQAHVNLMSYTYGKPRLGFVGPNAGDTVSTRQANATALQDAAGRMVVVGNESATIANSSTGTPTNRPGWVIAAGAMGAKAALAPQDSILGLKAQGVTDVPEHLTLSQMVSLAGNVGGNGPGCLLLSQSATGSWGWFDDLTTAPQNVLPLWSAMVNRVAEDDLIKRLTVAAMVLIGKAGGLVTAQRLQSNAAGALQVAITAGVIDSYTQVAVTQSAQNPTNWTETVSYVLRGEVRTVTINLAAS